MSFSSHEDSSKIRNRELRAKVILMIIIIISKDIQFVLKNAGFEYLNLKYLNRDVIENYFSQLKSNSYANTNPIPEQFQGI